MWVKFETVLINFNVSFIVDNNVKQYSNIECLSKLGMVN